MSIRSQLYDMLLQMPDGNAAARVAATGAFLDGLPPDQVPVVERRLLALAIVYRDSLAEGMKGKLEDFFAQVEAVERGLIS